MSKNTEDDNLHMDKISLLNIDSKYRNKIPSNILDSKIGFKENSISTTKDSKIVRINYPNHKLKINDRIVLTNVKSKSKKQYNSIYFINSSSYFLVNYNNHGISPDYLNYLDELVVVISEINSHNGDLPVNYNVIYGTKKVKYISDINLIGSSDNYFKYKFRNFQKNYFLVNMRKHIIIVIVY